MAHRRRNKISRSESKKRRGHSPENTFAVFNANQPVSGVYLSCGMLKVRNSHSLTTTYGSARGEKTTDVVQLHSCFGGKLRESLV